MPEITLKIRSQVGLHARPAAQFVQTAGRYTADVKVRNLTTAGAYVDAKSILMVLTLGVARDHEIQVQAEGADAEAALGALRHLIETDFGEPDS